MSSHTGIAALGLALPDLHFDVRTLAALRGVDPDKYTLGLGCDQIAWCGDDDVVDLAVKAAERALARWGGDPRQIGLLAVGTETAMDMSRPLSAFVAERLGLRGATRSYEVKHACYGGTLALRQALEWRWSGAAGDKAALVIAADVARYAPGSPAEATQGAGAVAMVVEAPTVARVARTSHPWSAPAFDFWRPVGEAYPRVQGKLSLDCYNQAVIQTFRALVGDRDPERVLDHYAAAAFHVPFPKMVKKGVRALGDDLGWSTAQADAWFDDKVAPTLAWNQQAGNAYTASLWLAVARGLVGRETGTPLLAFSYGSGFGAELLSLEAGPAAAEAAWQADIATDLAARRELDGQDYLNRRAAEQPVAVAAK